MCVVPKDKALPLTMLEVASSWRGGSHRLVSSGRAVADAAYPIFAILTFSLRWARLETLHIFQ